MAKQKYYSLKNILAKNAYYNIVFGERSNGKTFAALKYGLEQYVKTRKQFAIVRRWGEDITGRRGSVMFDALVSAGVVTQLTGGEWTNVYYYASKWYLCRFEDEKRITDERPFCYGFAISAGDHDKSTSYPDITTIVFDEFITRSNYLPDEFVLFMGVVSTIVRQRHDVKIIMLGNALNKYYCPYFNEMGLRHIKEMQQGTIDVYRYGDTELTVAVEYAAPSKDGKESDLYFAFDNPKLAMITGGGWEMAIYPHCPVKYSPKDIMFIYFIIYDGETLQCEVVYKGDNNFTFIHRKTTELKDTDKDLIYTPDFSPRPNYKRNITRPSSRIEQKIADYYRKDKIFYADNEVGEIVRNYLIFCGKEVD